MPELMTSVHKVYAGNGGAFLAKTIIKNNGSEPVTNLHISYRIPGYAEIAGQEDYPVILPGQTVNDYCYPTFDAEQMKSITTGGRPCKSHQRPGVPLWAPFAGYSAGITSRVATMSTASRRRPASRSRSGASDV